jgi:hypothetical protein
MFPRLLGQTEVNRARNRAKAETKSESSSRSSLDLAARFHFEPIQMWIRRAECVRRSFLHRSSAFPEQHHGLPTGISLRLTSNHPGIHHSFNIHKQWSVYATTTVTVFRPTLPSHIDMITALGLAKPIWVICRVDKGGEPRQQNAKGDKHNAHFVFCARMSF